MLAGSLAVALVLGAGLPASATLPQRPAVAVAVAAASPASTHKAVGAELYAVEYSVRDAAGSGAVIAGGELSVTPERPHAFEHRLPRGGEVEVVVEVRPRPDGTVVVELRLFEQLEGGEKIRWTPVVGLKRGGEATARVDWAGGGRTLALSLR